MTTPYYLAGDDLNAALLNAAPQPLVKVKLANHTVISDATLNTDPELTIPVPANTTWALETCLIYSSSTTADANFALAVPAAATHWQCSTGLPLGATASTDNIQMGVLQNSVVGVSAGGVGVSGLLMCPLRATIVIAGTAGNIAIQFCQWVSEATNTILYQGSWMILTRLA